MKPFRIRLLPGLLPAAFGVCAALTVSLLLMFHTFSARSNPPSLLIASKAWSDFGAHVPLIRSFSMGANAGRLIRGQAIESPLYPGEPIRYHFGFYAIAGLLERAGLRIDWALNLPSAAGFAGLLIMIYVLGKQLFGSRGVGVLAVILFLFNGSLSFVRFFAKHPLSLRTPADILSNSAFPSFGPWDGGTVTAFWNLNIYTNQRHLAASYALVLLLLYLSRNPRITRLPVGIGTGLLLGFLFFINYAAGAIAVLLLFWTMLVHPDKRRPLIIACAAAVIPVFMVLVYSHPGAGISYAPGYAIRMPLTVLTFTRFWLDNLGLHLFLIPVGVLLAKKDIRRLLWPPMLLLFAAPNLLRFSPDMINNHKFFNFFLILGNYFTALAAIRISTAAARLITDRVRKPVVTAVARSFFLVALLIPLTLSGIIDLFPVINDYRGIVADVGTDPTATYLAAHTVPDAVIANSTWFYHPASLAGRAIYSGYTYFTWSYGYDQDVRERNLTALYRAPDRAALCGALSQTPVSVIELDDMPEDYLLPNRDLWQSLPAVFEDTRDHRILYTRSMLCPE